jgi:flagellar basal body-associated protein FliL
VLSALIIVFREVLEAALVVGIVCAATRGVTGRSLMVTLGILLGVAGACLVALGADAIAGFASGMGQELFNALVLLAVVVLLSSHILWMSRHGEHLARSADTAGRSVRSGEQPLRILAALDDVAKETGDLVLVGGGLFFALKKSNGGEAAGEHHEAQAEAQKAPAQYVKLDPSFVINLDDEAASRYLQLDATVMTRDPETVKAVAEHLPRIRYELMLLFSQQHYDRIVTREGKEALQAQSLETVKKVLEQETGKADVEGLYFTTFVMQ